MAATAPAIVLVSRRTMAYQASVSWVSASTSRYRGETRCRILMCHLQDTNPTWPGLGLLVSTLRRTRGGLEVNLQHFLHYKSLQLSSMLSCKGILVVLKIYFKEPWLCLLGISLVHMCTVFMVLQNNNLHTQTTAGTHKLPLTHVKQLCALTCFRMPKY